MRERILIEVKLSMIKGVDFLIYIAFDAIIFTVFTLYLFKPALTRMNEVYPIFERWV